MGSSESRAQSWIILLLGAGIILALPFALKFGAVFFLPLTSALVVSIILSPLADRLVRFGMPNAVASLACLILFTVMTAVFITAIAQPAFALVERLPDLGSKAAETARGVANWLGPMADRLHVERLAQESSVSTAGAAMLGAVAAGTPTVLLNYLLVLLLSYFFVSSRVKIKRSLLLERDSVNATLSAARTVRELQDKVSHYVGTVTIINIGVGMVVAFGAWLFGLENPVMWGGFAAILNFVPYVGPLATFALLALTGVVELGSIALGLAPAACYLILHFVEANAITPSIVGQRLVIHPATLLIGISFFSWVWGAVGAILAIPLTIMLGVLLDRIGKPNIMGFLFGEPLFAAEDVHEGYRQQVPRS